MRINRSFDNTINYKAKLLSKYDAKILDNGIENIKKISIYSLNQEDKNFVEKFLQNIEKYKQNNPIINEILESALKTAQALLNSNQDFLKKVKIFLAVFDNKPCGLLVANLPKINNSNNSIQYSSRHNMAKNETELDWLINWNNNQNIKGIGKSLLNEYFISLKKDRFRDVFVRSELPENSQAEVFYKRMGFDEIGEKRIKMGKKNNNKYIVKSYFQQEDEVIPMIATRGNIKKIIEEISKKMNREEIMQEQIDLNELF